jgi:hypothetical protein
MPKKVEVKEENENKKEVEENTNVINKTGNVKFTEA